MLATAPLVTLVAWTWTAFVVEADNAVEAAGTERTGRLFPMSYAMWANGLRLVDESGVTVRELRTGARANCNLAGLERWRWVALGEDGPGRPGFGTRRGITEDTVVRPTRAGIFARRLWPRTVADVEERWRRRFGSAVDELRDALRSAPTDLPWSPPEVHASDGFRTRVVDGPGDAVEVPLAALLGRALTAETLDHERDAVVSLPLGANFLRLLADGPAPVADLHRSSGVSREAGAMALGFLDRRGLVARRSGRSLELTASGTGALDDYRARTAARRDRALRPPLVAILSRGDALAEGLRPPEGGWRWRTPYGSRTQRLLADPVSALPWHPMVLHRGGWPDGS